MFAMGTWRVDDEMSGSELRVALGGRGGVVGSGIVIARVRGSVAAVASLLEAQDHDKQAAEAARDAASFEPGHDRRQHISDDEAGRERQQNALYQAERDDDEQQQAEPEQQPIGTRAHHARRDSIRRRAQRAR